MLAFSLLQVYGRDEKSGTIFVEHRDMCMVSEGPREEREAGDTHAPFVCAACSRGLFRRLPAAFFIPLFEGHALIVFFFTTCSWWIHSPSVRHTYMCHAIFSSTTTVEV